MHKITEKEFTLDDFSTDQLCKEGIFVFEKEIEMFNGIRDVYISETDSDLKKAAWWQLIQLLPTSYNQTRNVMLNYEVLKNMYHSRKNHKLDEWVEFCKWIETLPYSELI